MAELKFYRVNVDIPKNVDVIVESNTIIIKGTKGEVRRKFINPRIEIVKEDNVLIVRTKNGIKGIESDKNFVCTYAAHLKNMIVGVVSGYVSKVKICSGHFPMQVSLDSKSVIIKNFLGEKLPRRANIMENVKVKIDGDVITITGIDKESVSQTAARIEQSTRITNKDRRIFQDGCFITQKARVEQDG